MLVKPVTPERQLGLGQKLAYSMGGVANNYMSNFLPGYALLIFSVGLGVEPWKIGVALGVPRIWDAITDPICGHLSDSCTSRWGRRRPFMLAGSIGVLLTFGLLFLPTPSWSSDAIFWWFLAMSLLYYTATTLFAIPYLALGYEISTDSKERAQLMTLRSFVSNVFSLLMPWFYAMCFWNWRALVGSGTLVDRVSALIVSPDKKELLPPTYQFVFLGLALFMALLGCCTLFCKERPIASQPTLKEFWQSFRTAFRNRPFLLLNGSLIFAMLGIFLVMPLAGYVNLYYLFDGNQGRSAGFLATVTTLQTVFSIAIVPVAGWLLARVGATRIMKVFLMITALSFATKYWTYTPAHPWLQLVPLFIWAFGWCGTMLTYNVMMCDVCDYDDYQTGVRREGIYASTQQFVTKLVIALSTILAGGLLSASGIVAKAATQTPHAIWLLRVEFSILPFLIALAASCAFFFYPLTDKRANEIREAIKARKNSDDHG